MKMVLLCHTEFLIHAFGEKENIITHCPEVLSLTNLQEEELELTFLFKSKDLVSWDYLHPFIEGDSFTRIGDDGACPYFWPIGEDRYILYFFSHMSGGQALLGDYDKKRDKF